MKWAKEGTLMAFDIKVEQVKSTAGDAENLSKIYEYFPEASKGLDAYTQALGGK